MDAATRTDESVIVDVAQNPRVAQLLGRIEETRRIAHEHPEGHPTRTEAERSIADLYAELGRYVHWLVRQDPAALARVQEEGRRWARSMEEALGFTELPDVSEELVEEDEGDEDESFASSASFTAVELTGDSRIDALDVRRIDTPEWQLPEVSVAPEPSDAGTSAASVSRAGGAEEEPVALGEASATGPGEERDAVVVRTGSFDVPAEDRVRRSGVRPPRTGDAEWLGRLRELLDVLGPPREVPPQGPERDALLRSVAMVTTNLELRWSVFPDSVQQALLGLVAARARRLQHELPAEPDLRLALGRMRRFAEERGLALMPALGDSRDPHRDWGADEQRYWTVLHAGA